MLLKVIVDEQQLTLNVPDVIVEGAQEVFDKMDRDMDAGWQMGREWVSSPDVEQRCQIVANKLLTALENENDTLGRMMAAYILSRMPTVETVEIDTIGELQNTVFTFGAAPPTTGAPAAPSAIPPPAPAASRLEALEQAGREVTKVFKVGHQYRFSVYNQTRAQWEDSPAIADKAEAEALRDQAVKRRFDELVAGG
jgi:hypothetical protein